MIFPTVVREMSEHSSSIVTPDSDIPSAERVSRDTLATLQGRRLERLLSDICGRNAFYTRKLEEGGVRVESLRFPDDLTRLPLTSKNELIADSLSITAAVNL